MTTAVKAIYEHGVFRPKERVQLEERTEVEVLIPLPVDEGDPTGWKAADRLIGIADDPGGPTDVSENHDEYLYGNKRPR
ncbi:MAG TPA: antitoxin family protein [Vicinamibacteria bacterium]|nr:antitoxin family protein [Vicinamibacteria bacterium]